MMKNKINTALSYFFILSFILIAMPATADVMRIKGVVVDSLTNEPIPFATVAIDGTSTGTLTNDDGVFELVATTRFPYLSFTAMGFSSVKLSYRDVQSSPRQVKVRLAPTGIELGEVVIKPKRQKYSKKNNPAVDFVNKIRKAKRLYDPRRNDYYNYDKYERITLALNDISAESEKNVLLKKFEFLRDYIDTSAITGKPILNFSTREKISTVHYRKTPEAEKEVVDGTRIEGLDDFLNQDDMRVIYENLFNDIDLYKSDVEILNKHFVSPLSPLAPDFYRFYLTDTTYVDSVKCVELSFVPHNPLSYGFTGKIYVPEGDTTMFVKKVRMNVPYDNSLNFVDNITINQEFIKSNDGSRMLVKDDIVAELSAFPGTKGIYFRRNTAYGNHNFEAYGDSTLYEMMGSTLVVDDSDRREAEFWDNKRLIPLSDTETKVGDLANHMRSNKLYYWAERIVKILMTGYVSTSKTNSKFDVGPVTNIISSNHLEGFRLRAGGMTTANFSKRWFLKGYTAYGFKDNKWKYGAEVEYSFNDKKYHQEEFPIHSIKIGHKYDVDMLGQHFAAGKADNMFLSIKRHDDKQITYHRVSELVYTLELANHFSVQATLRHVRQEATQWMTFMTGYGRLFDHYNQASISLRLRYAPGEVFYNARNERKSFGHYAPIFTLTHTYSPKGFMGSQWEINKTELSIQKRFWLSAFGHIDGILKGGHLWSKVPYPELLIPSANMSYTIQPQSFSLMNPMEFMTDSYASLDLAYSANGTIFNYIPLIKHLKWREVFTFKGMIGHLSQKNNPDYDKDLLVFPMASNSRPMGHTPYMEAGVGIDNIFKLFRVDYVWRLTYRDAPGIDKSGVRVGLHITF